MILAADKLEQLEGWIWKNDQTIIPYKVSTNSGFLWEKVANFYWLKYYIVSSTFQPTEYIRYTVKPRFSLTVPQFTAPAFALKYSDNMSSMWNFKYEL